MADTFIVASVEQQEADDAPKLFDTSTVASAEQQEAVAAPKLTRKARRKARSSARRSYRRAREKEERLEKEKIRAEKRAAGELDDDDSDEHDSRLKKKIKLDFGGRVVIDLAFDDEMPDKKIPSLCSQLTYTYSANRKASYPFSLLFTSLSGRIKTRLENNGANRWDEVEWWTEGYEHLWTLSERPVQGQAPDITCMDEPKTLESTSLLNARAQAKSSKDTVVYITADSAEELSEIKPEETYIIGGVSDLSVRYKNICLDKAKGYGIRTARLPIERYLASRKVLTMNQIFEIMAKWVQTRSWEEALYAVVPERKFQAGERNINITFSW